MKKYAIVADATCDLSEEFRMQYDIQFVPGHLICSDGTDLSSSPAWDHYGREEFYSTLKKNPGAFTTSPPSVGEFAVFFEKLIADGYDVLCITISTGISGTYGFACQARDMVLEKYPDSQIVCVDSMRFGPGFGLLCVYASQLRKEGKTLSEVAEFLEENKNRFHQMGWLDDLSFCAKKGRLTNAKAFFGTLVGVKPLGEFDYNGLTTVVGKVKGEKKAYSVILDYIRATGENLSDQIIFIAQTDRKKQAEAFKIMVEEQFHPRAVYICDVFPSNGVNIGPGLMAAYYVGAPITQGLEKEKALIEKLIAEKE